MYYKPSSERQDEYKQMQNDRLFQVYLSFIQNIIGINLLPYQKILLYRYTRGDVV